MINGHQSKSVGPSSGGRQNRLIMVLMPRLVLLGVMLASVNSAYAQFGFGFNNIGGVVGGVSVDASGTVRTVTRQERERWLNDLRSAVADPSAAIADASDLRMVSLKGLQAEIRDAIQANRPLSEEVLYLAGLQRVTHIFVYPQRNDVVLAGPAEGWRVRQDAVVVGQSSGRPVLQLEDLLTALRTADAARERAISVSIDPTAEGEVRLNRLLGQMRGGPRNDPSRMEPALRKAFGEQIVSLTTLAEASRMASTLVAADYHMKRLAMNLEEPGVSGLPSYMEMIRDVGAPAGRQPRWWMTCDYDGIAHSQDMLAWKITGRGIKALSEEELVDATGNRRATGETNPYAQRWADRFTEKLDELCAHQNAAFGDLRNVMDLNIVATIIRAYDLESVAGADFGLLLGTGEALELPRWQTPKTISPEFSFVRGRAGWTVSASGGVEINPWKVVSQQSHEDNAIAAVHAGRRGDRIGSLVVGLANRLPVNCH